VPLCVLIALIWLSGSVFFHDTRSTVLYYQVDGIILSDRRGGGFPRGLDSNSRPKSMLPPRRHDDRSSLSREHYLLSFGAAQLTD